MQAREILERARDAHMESERYTAQEQGGHGTGRYHEAHARRLQERLKDAEDAMDRAYEVIYGQAGAGLTERQRDVLYHRYLCAEKWEAVARHVFCAARTCQAEHDKALAILDGAEMGRATKHPAP